MSRAPDSLRVLVSPPSSTRRRRRGAGVHLQQRERAVGHGQRGGRKVAVGKLVVVDGAEVSAKITGLTNSKENTAAAPSGFYLLTAVDNGPGQQASPAIGGVDMSGETGQSQWITNFPYAGSEELVVPIGADLVARTTVKVLSSDDLTNVRRRRRGACCICGRIIGRRRTVLSTYGSRCSSRLPDEVRGPSRSWAAGRRSVGEQLLVRTGRWLPLDGAGRPLPRQAPCHLVGWRRLVASATSR